MDEPVAIRRGVWAMITWALSRLRALWRRRVSAVVSVPVAGDCAHDQDAQALLLRLLVAVNDPGRMQNEVARLAGCQACSTVVLVQAVYELAGLVLDQGKDTDDQPSEPSRCDHRAVVPEVVALRLALAYDVDNGDVLTKTLQEIWGCPSCVLDVLMSLVRANVSILDDTKVEWQPLLERRLLTILDEVSRGFVVSVCPLGPCRVGVEPHRACWAIPQRHDADYPGLSNAIRVEEADRGRD
jgi:hypothetical protein